jgi:hypothetical protein
MNGFKRGSGCYKCTNCGRQTRATGGNDNEHLRMCVQCYDLGGIENEISDNGSTPELEAEAQALRDEIVKLGGSAQ